MASYQQEPAYQTYQTNPYQLPTQQIVQAIQTRNQYWDSAASNLRNSYQNFLNLQLSNPANKEKLNGLMEGVTQNLQSASKTDLSLGENYGKALSIFDPITKDDNIMGDNAITRDGMNQLQTGMQQRTTNSGKDYNQASMQEISNHLSDFSKADPNNWRQFYNSRPVYRPYFDFMADKRTVDKGFKPDTTDFTTPIYVDANGKPTNDWKNGSISPYLLNTHDKSLVASQYRAYLDANLDPRGKDQMALEGRVRYHDQPGALANDYGNILGNQVNSNKLQIESLKGRLPTSTPAQQEVFNDEIKRLSGDNDEKTLQMSKIKAGDFSDIMPQKDALAGFVHTNNLIGYMASASAHKDITVKYSESGLYKDMYNQTHEDTRQINALTAAATQGDLNRANRIEVQLLKLGFKNGKSVLPLTGAQNYQISTGEGDEHFGADVIDKMKTDSDAEYKQAQDNVKELVKSSTPGYDAMSADAQRAAEAKWYADNKWGSDNFNAAAEKKTLNDQYFKAVDDFVDKQIQEKNPDIYNKKTSVLNSIPSQGEVLNISEDGKYNPHPIRLSGDDLRGVLNGTNPNMKIVTVTKHEGSHGPDDPGQDYDQSMLQINGKNYEFGDSMLRRSYNGINQGNQAYQELRSKIMDQNLTKITGIHNFIGDEEKNPQAKAIHGIAMSAMMGGDAGKIEDKDLKIVAVDNNGGVYVKLQGDANINQKEVQKNIANLPGGAGRYIKAINAYYIPANQFGDLTKGNSYQDPRLDVAQKEVDFRGQVKPTESYDLPPMHFADRDFHFKVTSVNGQATYEIVDGTRGARFSANPATGQPFKTIEDAAAVANSLGNKNITSDQQYDSLVKTIGHGN